MRRIGIGSVCLLLSASGGWSDTAYWTAYVTNIGCDTVAGSISGFATFNGNQFGAGTDAFTLGPGATTIVGFSCYNAVYTWGHVSSEACDGILVAPHDWTVGTAGGSCSPASVPASGPATNIVILTRTQYVPVFARVRLPGGGFTNSMVRMYRKEIQVLHTNL